MDIHQQIVSLPLAKRLKELGYKMPSYCAWVCFEAEVDEATGNISKARWELWPEYNDPEGFTYDYCWAYTAAELLDILPQAVERDDHYFKLSIAKNDQNQWQAAYSLDISAFGFTHREGATHTLADALARLLIYLLENKLIEIK